MEEIEYLKKYMEEQNIEKGIERLKKGEAVQYIVGHVNFYGNKIKVNKNVLIPRFETEELIEKTVSYIRKYFSEDLSILDIGTGSGNIAITMKKLFPKSNITACDISKDALEVAKENASLHKTSISFIESDILKNIEGKFDVIISNPPYIAYDEEIMDIVKENEPHIALYADDHGLYFYKKIIKDAQKYLKEKSMIAFEIGCTQKKDLQNYIFKYFPQSEIIFQKDLSGKDRFLFIINL